MILTIALGTKADVFMATIIKEIKVVKLKNFRYVEDRKIQLTEKLQKDMKKLETKLFDLEIEILNSAYDFENKRVRIIEYFDKDYWDGRGVYCINIIQYINGNALCLRVLPTVDSKYKRVCNIVKDIVLAGKKELVDCGFSVVY